VGGVGGAAVGNSWSNHHRYRHGYYSAHHPYHHTYVQ
jgi:hypothetical protein